MARPVCPSAPVTRGGKHVTRGGKHVTRGGCICDTWRKACDTWRYTQSQSSLHNLVAISLQSRRDLGDSYRRFISAIYLGVPSDAELGSRAVEYGIYVVAIFSLGDQHGLASCEGLEGGGADLEIIIIIEIMLRIIKIIILSAPGVSSVHVAVTCHGGYVADPRRSR